MAADPDDVMTIGSLSRRCGVPVKTLRAYEELGLIRVTETLREMGLTLAEITDMMRSYSAPGAEQLGARFTRVLDAVRNRTEQRMADLQLRLEKIRQFEAQFAEELAGTKDFGASDPRRAPLDSPTGGRS